MMERNQRPLLRAAAITGLLFSTPSFAQTANCHAPLDTAGGPGNAHTRYIEKNLQPAVIKPGTNPSALPNACTGSTCPDSASR